MTDAALRDLERRAQAQPDDARAWAALAVELQRLGREDDALRAALRSLRIDSDLRSPAREALPALGVRRASGPRLESAVPWAGARFGAPRVLQGLPVPDAPAVADVGGGLVAYQSDQDVVAIDVVTGTVAWRRQVTGWPSWLGDRLFLWQQARDQLILTPIDPRTGEPADEAMRLAAPQGARWRPIDDRHIVAVDHLRASHQREAAATVHVFDGTSGAVLGRFETLPSMFPPSIVGAGGRIVVGDVRRADMRSAGISGHDLDGRERWRVRGVSCMGRIDDGVLVSAISPDGPLRILDPDDGSALASFLSAEGAIACVTARMFVINHQDTLYAFERGSCARLWSPPTSPPGGYPILATRDVAMWFDGGCRGSPGEVVAYDLASAALRSRVRLTEGDQQQPPRVDLALCAGHVVVAIADPEPRPPMIVELSP